MNCLHRRVSIVAFLLAICSWSRVHADSRAWAAARRAFPPNLRWIVGARLDGIRENPFFQAMWLSAERKTPASAAFVDALKSSCDRDVADLFDSIVIGSRTDFDDAVLVFALRDMNRSSFDACIKKVWLAMNATETIEDDGDLTWYRDANDYVIVRWLDDGAFAITASLHDETSLKEMTSGGLARDRVASSLLPLAKPDSTIWAVVLAGRHVDIADIDVEVTHAYGHLDVARGDLSGEVHVVTTSAKRAARAAAKNQRQLAEVAQSPDVPAKLRELFGAVSVKAKGKEILYEGRVSLDTLLQVAAVFAPTN